jgi:hypothetical protein
VLVSLAEKTVKGVGRRLGNGLSKRVKLASRDAEPFECI